MEDLRIECLRLEIPAIGLDKGAIQRRLLEHLVARATSTPMTQSGAPPVFAAVAPDPVGPDLEDLDLEEPVDQYLLDQETLYSPPRQGDSILHPGDDQNPDPADQSSGVIRFQENRSRHAEAKPPALSRTLPQYSDVSDLQLQLRRLELEHEREREERKERERERESEKSESESANSSLNLRSWSWS